MAEEVQSGYVPGRALSPDAYGNSFVDFYKDYIGSTGIESTVPIDDEDDVKKETYQAPNIMDVGGDDNPDFNLLSGTFQPNKSGGGTTFYDNKVSNVDIQSMDLSSKSWDDYKKGQGRTDKSEFKRNAQITGVGLGFAGVSGALLGGALLGKKEPTPWGSENLGAGMVNVFGNMAASAKYDAFKEIQTLAAIEDYDFTDLDGTSYNKGDGGYAINVDGTVLVRSPGNSNYIGTLPNGMSNQQVLSLEAIDKSKRFGTNILPPREGTYFNGGIPNEEGFGVSGLGGYTSTGGFIDANGQSAAYGSMAALESLAKTDFGGSREKAEQWLSEVRSGRSMFDFTPHMTHAEAQAIKDRINGTSSEDGSTSPTTTFTNYDSGNFKGNQDVSKNYVSGSITNTMDFGGPKDYSDFGTVNRPDPVPGGGYAGEGQIRTSITPISYQDDTTFTGVTSGRAKEALRDAADRSARMQEAERQDKKSSQFGTFTESNFQPRDMSEGSQTSDEVTVDNRSEDEKGQKSQDYSMTFADDAASSDTGGGDKIVCTAMNNAYGFGSFRQTIWLRHSRNLDPAYQTGYHRLFRPLIKYAYTEDSLPNRIVKKWLEGVAKRRTADIWLQQRGNKRHLGGRIERAILEPICYIVGKL